jgi:hypothetical protein
MMPSMRRFLVSVAALSAVWWQLSACNFDLAPSTVCVGGICPPPNTVAASSTVSTSAGSGGSGGGAVCFADCPDNTKPTGKTGQFPCAVEKALKVCGDNCHGPLLKPQEGPFDIIKYEDTQKVPAPEKGYSTVLFYMIKDQIEAQMPRSPFKETYKDSDRKLVMDWACACGPPRPAGEVCQ